MKVNEFIQTLYATITQQSATMLINSDMLLAFTNFGLADIFSFEGRIWQFQVVQGKTFTTTGADISFTHTIADSTTQGIQRIISMRYKKGTEIMQTIGQLKNRQDGIVERPDEIGFITGNTSFIVHDKPGQVLTYEYSYAKSFKMITDLNADLPIPDMFIPALHSLALSYVLIPYGQYADQKEMNMYQKGLQQLSNLAKSDGFQAFGISLNIK